MIESSNKYGGSIVGVLSKSSAIAVVSTSCNYFLTLMLARQGAEGEFAFYAYCLTWSAILISVVDMCSEQVFVHRAVRTKDLYATIWTVLVARSFAITLILAIWFASSIFVEDPLPLYVLLMLMPSLNLGVVFEYSGKNITFVKVVLLERLLLLTSIYLVISKFGFTYHVFLAYFGVTSLIVLLQVFLLRSTVRMVKFGKLSDVKSYIADYWPMFLIVQSQLGYGYLSRLIIESKKGLDVFASVALALQIVNLVALFQTQVDKIFRRRIIESVNENDTTGLKILVQHYLAFTTLPIAFVVVVFMVFSRQLAAVLFPEGYDELGDSIRILSPLMVSINLSRLSDILWTAIAQPKVNMQITTVAVFTLLSILSVMNQAPLLYYLLAIVLVQYAQVTISITYFYRAFRNYLHD